MSDRVKGFTVVLDKDIRDDDFEAIERAVRMIRGVLGVSRSLCDSDDWMNRERVKWELRDQILKVLI